MVPIEFLSLADLKNERASLLKEARLTFSDLLARSVAGTLTEREQAILREIEDLDYLASVD